jgi:hypothetical protein
MTLSKVQVGWLVVLAVFVFGFFAVYGAVSWFYPESAFASVVAIPVGGIGLYCAYYLCRRATPVVPAGRSKISKPFFCTGIAFLGTKRVPGRHSARKRHRTTLVQVSGEDRRALRFFEGGVVREFWLV